MVTFLSGLKFMQNLGIFSVIATFVLVTAIIYAILFNIKVFGDSDKASNINLIVAVSVAFLFIMVAEAVSFLSLIVPILVVGLIVTFFIITLAFFIGLQPKRLGEQIEAPGILFAIVAFVVVSIVVVLDRTVPYLFPWATAKELENIPSIIEAVRIVYHPTILGLVAMLIIFIVVAYSISAVKKY